MDRVQQRLRVEEQDQPQHHDERLQREVAHEQDAHAANAAGPEAADVAEHDQRDERERQGQRLAAIAERAPEHLQVLGRREGRDGDQDHVVEQDRPAGDEADELVERVAREHRRAASVLVQRGALDVGHRRQHEQQRGDQEHQRRQPQRVAGDHAQREVDRARQRRVDDREQDRRADAAAQRSRASAAASSRRCARRSRRALIAPRLLRDFHVPPRPPPAAMNSTPSSSRGEIEPPCPLDRLDDQRHRRSTPSPARARTCPCGAPVGRSSHLSLGPRSRAAPVATRPRSLRERTDRTRS